MQADVELVSPPNRIADNLPDTSTEEIVKVERPPTIRRFGNRKTNTHPVSDGIRKCAEKLQIRHGVPVDENP